MAMQCFVRGGSKERVQEVRTPLRWSFLHICFSNWFVYLTGQWRHSLEVHPLLRKILDPPLDTHVKSQFQGKKPVLPFRNFRVLYYMGIQQRLQHLIIQFHLYYLLVVAYEKLKTKENFKLLAPKVVAVAYERWLLTRGSQCSEWFGQKTFGILGTGCWGEVYATGCSTVICLWS